MSLTLLGDSRFKVTFVDGSSGEVDMRAFLGQSDLGVFEPLRDPAQFAKATVEDGVVCWPCGVDLAPDAMHDEIKRKGRWILR